MIRIRDFSGKLSVLNAILFTLGAALLVACGSIPSSQLVTTNSPNLQKGTSSSRTGYHVTNKLTIGGDAGWDYILIDPQARRVYITHYQKIEVLDIDTGNSVGRITDMNGARGIALVKSIDRGYATNGKTDTVSVIDLKTFKHVAELKAGKKPDAIIYDPGTDRVFVNNGDGDDMTVIDATAGKVIGTIPLGHGPEFLAADGKGTVWVNLYDDNAFVTVDVKTLKVTKTTPIAGCESPSSMAFDSANRWLFIGCKNHVLAAVDPDSGKVVQTLPIGEHVDATIFDAANHLIFASTGDGVLTISRQDSAINTVW